MADDLWRQHVRLSRVDWLFGPFDLLVEHSHRLLGTVAGFLSIGLLLSAWFFESRKWFKWWSAFVLLAVIAQGALGGARVVLDQRTFAMIHGCTGPLFFAIATATAVSARAGGWADRAVSTDWTTSRATWMATGLLLASYFQLTLGAQLRHVTGAVSHSTFMMFVHSHLTMAAIVACLAVAVAASTGLRADTPRAVRFPAGLLVVLFLVQIGLGIATWVVNYALPWQELSETLASYTILAKGFWESIIVTAHMATGSLIISLATVTALRAWRSRVVGGAREVNGSGINKSRDANGMEISSAVAVRSVPARGLSGYVELTKPRILTMILLTVVMAMVAAGTLPSLITVLHACVGTALVAASASVLNQWMERERDAIMLRTCKRPLPSGRVASSQAAWMGWVMVILGSLYLGVLVNLPTMYCDSQPGDCTFGLHAAEDVQLDEHARWNASRCATRLDGMVCRGRIVARFPRVDPSGRFVAWQLPHLWPSLTCTGSSTKRQVTR